MMDASQAPMNRGGSVKRSMQISMALILAAALSQPADSATPNAAAAKPAAQPTPTAATAAPAKSATAPAVSDAPFWSGRPNAQAFANIQADRVTRAKKNIERMLAATGPRTVENTLQPYDDALLELDAAGSQCGLIEEVHPDSGLRASAEKATQDVSAYGSQLSLNRKVYEAITALDTTGLDAETAYYIRTTLRDFRLAGVDKDDSTRKQIQALREQLVKMGQNFDRNIREDKPTVVLDGVADLEGLPQDYIDSHKPGPDGKITLSVEYPDYFPLMTYARREAARQKMYMTYQNRAYPKNMAVLDSILDLRYRLAKLIGFSNYADYECADKMVGNAQNASDFIKKVVDASADRLKADFNTMLERKRKDFPGATGIDWWDRFYWTNLIKKEQYSFDAQGFRPYFPYTRVKQGVLDVTSKLFGVTYKQVANAPVWDPSVECWEMFEDGKLVGRFYLDMHPRKNKYNHAAQFDVRTGVEGRQIPEAALICNLPGGDAKDPGLCELEDVDTFFHEFGHLLHTLFAGHHRWVGIGGIRTERDFVEAPSQLLEEWMRDPAVLQSFARHYKSGEPVPAKLVEQMRRADDFGNLDPRAIDVRRQMMLADLSLSIYNRPPSQVNTDSLNAQLTNRYTPYPYVPGTHFQCAFGHLYGYGAGYYTYMWSLVIAKDMFSKFDRKNLLDPAIAKRYRDAVLAPGGSAPAAVLVSKFLGRPFNFEAYRLWLNQTAPN
jgi:thimet oligopeptidase